MPLSGIRILDLTRLIPGPLASLVLADLGATVDKVEDTGAGDYLRHIPPRLGDEGAAFQTLNRGKRSLVLDLKHPRGRETLLAMATRYDVVFEQFRPGVLDKLGVGHDVLLRENPRLVVCALTGYGQTGPLRDRAGHDVNYLARAGILGVQGPPDGAPQLPGFQLADVSGGLFSVIGILAALRERDRTGRGRVVDVAMCDSVQAFAPAAFGAMLAGEMPTRGDDLLTGGIAPYNTYVAKDGAPMALGALEPKFWTAFCLGVGIEPDVSALAPGPHQAAWKARVAEIFRSRTRTEWEAFAAAHDCCLEPVLAPDELRGDAHLAARGVFFELDAPGGKLPQFRTPVTPRDRAFSAPPRAGEHTDEILREAGFDAAAIAELRAAGAVR